jgi:hypothetical protein
MDHEPQNGRAPPETAMINDLDPAPEKIEPNRQQARAPRPPLPVNLREEGDFSDMLSELRILLPGAQMLTSFLIILPFNGGARQFILAERFVFLATFFFALTSLVLLSAPAIQHRIMRPLMNRARFKCAATRQIVAGSLALALAFILGTNLVIAEVFGRTLGNIASVAMATLFAAVWGLLPIYMKRRHDF